MVEQLLWRGQHFTAHRRLWEWSFRGNEKQSGLQLWPIWRWEWRGDGRRSSRIDFSISIFWSPTKTRIWSAMLCYVPAARGLIPWSTRYGGNPAANCGRGKRDKETLNGKMWTQKTQMCRAVLLQFTWRWRGQNPALLRQKEVKGLTGKL